jgi:CRP/FNR family transcriptional regulator, cyclic AMP receptor protein
MRQTLHLPSHDACETLTAVVSEHALAENRTPRRKHYASGSAIWTPADLPDRVFRLHAGRVHIVAVNREGHEQLYRTVAPGELFGEMCFCSHRHEPHGTVARCLGRSDVSATSFTDFKRALREDASQIDAVIQTFCGRVTDAERRVQVLACRDARERLARLLLHIAQRKIQAGSGLSERVALTITHAELAAMAALSRPHVTVLMTGFRARRLVSYGRTGPLHIHTGRLRRLIQDE